MADAPLTLSFDTFEAILTSWQSECHLHSGISFPTELTDWADNNPYAARALFMLACIKHGVQPSLRDDFDGE